MLFKHDGVEIEVVRPSFGVDQESEGVRKRTLRKAVSEGRPTQAKVWAHALRTGVWDSDKQAQSEQLDAAIAADQELLAATADRAVALRLKSSRAARQELRAEVNRLEQESADALALQAQFDYLVAACTRHAATGRPVFASPDEYARLRKQGDAVAARATWGVSAVLYGMPESLPEDAVLAAHAGGAPAVVA